MILIARSNSIESDNFKRVIKYQILRTLFYGGFDTGSKHLRLILGEDQFKVIRL